MSQVGKLVEALKDVHWHPYASKSPALSQFQVDHGFAGRDRPHPECHYLKQIHSSALVRAGLSTSPEAENRVEADGIVTGITGLVVAVRTADCLPILLYAPDIHQVAAIHAGWRGLTAGILAKAVGELVSAGAGSESIVAAVGPALNALGFEVGPEVVNAVLSTEMALTPEMAGLVIGKGVGDRWHVDMSLAAVLTLKQNGLMPNRISVMQSCTKADPRWFSFRREGRGVGSNWSWIKC